MRFVTDIHSRNRYTTFLESHPRCNFQQSVEWANVKSCWKNEIVLAEDGQGNITGGLSVLIRKIPFFGSLMYCARGPVCDTDDADALRQLTEGAAALAKQYHAMALRMEPDVPITDRAFKTIMADLGYRFRDPAADPHDVIQPRHVFRLDIKGKTEAEVMALFNAKVRYNIRAAERRGVEVREGTRKDLKIFHRLMAETARRDHFLPRPLSYLEKVYDELGPEHTTLLMAYYEGQPIAGAMPIFYGNKTWYAFGASSDASRKLMSGYLLQWEMIKLAIARGDDVYDLRGVLEVTDENQPGSGLYCFKRRFGGDLVEFVGETYMPYKPVTYALYRKTEKAYMALRGVFSRPQASEPLTLPARRMPSAPPRPGHCPPDSGFRLSVQYAATGPSGDPGRLSSVPRAM